MKKYILISVLIITIILMFLFLYNYRIEQEHFVSTYSLSQNEINKLKDGDIILRRGFGMVSDLIVTTMDEEYDISHCAIIVKDNKHFKVIHTVSQSLSEFDGVQSQPLSRFISDSKENSIIVVRLKGITDSSISQRAKYFLSKKIPFDHDFDITDSSKLYCTELIWKVIKDSYNIDVFENQLKDKDKKNQYRFSALMDTNRFDIIINHHLKR